jgi:cytochrome P450 family 4
MLAFITADPKYFEVVLSSQKILTKSSMYNFLREWLGTGLLLSSGKKWFNRRKAITPTFHFKILEQFIEIFNRQNEIFVEKLKVRGNEQPFDVVPDVALMALDVLSETAMGTQLNAQLNQESEYVKAVKE